MSEEGKLLQLHIEEDRLALQTIREALTAMDTKLDALALSLIATQTEIKLKSKWLGSVLGFLGGVAGAVIVGLLS